MKWKTMFLTTALMTAVFVTPAHALDYTVDAPSAGDFGTPTSDETIYVSTPAANVDRGKNAAIIPPTFGRQWTSLWTMTAPATPW